MRKRFILLAFAVIPFANAGSLTTTFNSNNGGADQWTNYFDLTALVNPLAVTGLDVNVQETSAFSLEVYTRSGTYDGFETNGGAGWTLVSTGTAVGLGADGPTFVDIADFNIGANVTGVAVRSIGASMRYTEGNNVYGNADLTLSAGTSSETTAGAFANGSEVFSPRTWNGTVYYDTNPVPEPASMAALGLGALVVAARKRRKRA